MNDADEIRKILQSDRAWAAYFLADLAPGFFEKCEWSRSGAASLAAIYRGLTPPVLFGMGDPAEFAEALRAFESEPAFLLHLQPAMLPSLTRGFDVVSKTAMWRMALAPDIPVPPVGNNVGRLSEVDVEALEQLYSDGKPYGEHPEVYSSSMVADGIFAGVWEHGELVAVAGTHIVSLRESVAAIGNVYTRRDRRGQGLGETATNAVIAMLRRRDVRTIVLSVKQSNDVAIRLYERLGFEHHCEFYEGRAERRPA